MWDIVKVSQRRPRAVEVIGGALGELLAASRAADGTGRGAARSYPKNPPKASKTVTINDLWYYAAKERPTCLRTAGLGIVH